jgi:peroxiredoxin
LRDIVEDLNGLNTTMVAISPQNQAKNDELVEKHKLNFDLVRDEGNAYCKEMGIVFKVADEIIDIYNGFGISLPDSNGEDSWSLPMPTRLVVSQDGIVRAADTDPNHTARPEPQKTIDDVKALG